MNMTQDNPQKTLLTCELIKSEWNSKKNDDFCVNPSTNCMDKTNDVKNYLKEDILNLHNEILDFEKKKKI